MTTLDQARDLARSEIAACGIPVSVIREERRAFGWLFYYQSDAYLRSGSISDQLAGNGPVLVGDDGSVCAIPSFVDVSSDAAVESWLATEPNP